MAKISMEGLDEYTEALSRLATELKGAVIGPAVYDGADIAADAIRAEMEALPTAGGLGPPQGNRQLVGPNKLQKEALLDSFGISKMQDDSGYYNVKLGWSGYNAIRTKRWPKGQPNVLIARAVARGTSFLRANNFVKRAMATAKPKALATMEKAVDKGLKDIMKK